MKWDYYFKSPLKPVKKKKTNIKLYRIVEIISEISLTSININLTHIFSERFSKRAKYFI